MPYVSEILIHNSFSTKNFLPSVSQFLLSQDRNKTSDFTLQSLSLRQGRVYTYIDH